jgi:signal transduction histidine kinase
MKQIIRLVKYIFIGVILTSNCFAKDLPTIHDSTSYFTSALNPDQLRFSLQDKQFSIQKNRRFKFGLTTNEYCYIIIKLNADSSSNSYLLSIDNTSLDTVLIYSLSENASKRLLYKGGNLIEYDLQRLYVWHTIPLAISPELHYYLVAIKAYSKNVNVAYQIMTSGDLQILYRSFDKLIYFYVGIIFLIMFTSLAGAAIFKNRGLIIYTGYILMVTIWILAHYGYLYPTFYPSYPELNKIIKPVSILLALVCFLSLILYLFKKDLKETYFYKTAKAIKLLNSVFVIIAFLYITIPFPSYIYTLYNIGWNILMVLSVSIVIIMLAWLFKANKTARIFSLALTLLLLIALLKMLSNLGFINSNFLNDHGITIASLLEILMLIFGVFLNIWEDKEMQNKQLSLLEDDKKRTMQRLIAIQDDERKRIAEDLHDSIGPMLAAIKINFLRIVKAKDENKISDNLVTETESIIDDSLTEIRNISHQLMPKGLSSKGLINLLAEYFTDLQIVYNTQIDFTHSISVSLDKDIQLNIYRIISELVLNGAKHSSSKNITVSIETRDTETVVIINDDGKGFNATQKNNSSSGLKNVESRVAYLKGKMHMQSSVGAGTFIEISLPQNRS